jgi:hypothetical protein
MNAIFTEDGVKLELEVNEYQFVYSVLSYVLSGIKISDNDFRNILMMPKDDGKKLMAQLGEMEDEARFRGNHWIKGPVPYYDPETNTMKPRVNPYE